MIKLVLTDMDNTLVPLGQRFVSERTIEAIHAVQEAGVRFGPDTGRDYVELMRMFRTDESCFSTGILSNGKRVCVDGKTVAVSLLDNRWLRDIATALEPLDYMFLVCYPLEANLLNTCCAIGTTDEEMAYYERMTSFTGVLFDEVPDMKFVAATIACGGGPDSMDVCKRVINEAVPEVDVVSPIPNWFDVLPKGVTKASGLDMILQACGVKKDEVAIFGDAGNDLAILSRVPYSVAVANANPEVKAVANYEVGASADEGMADALFEVARAAKAGEMPEFLCHPVHPAQA